jgi:hypothetical protein
VLTICAKTAFRTAHSSFYPGPLARSPREVYHSLLPHPALAPVPMLDDPASGEEQARNEQAWRHLLVQGVLAVLLPTEDLRNPCLRSLVEEIVAENILGNIVLGKLSESWIIWELITNAIERMQKERSTAGANDKKRGKVEHSHDKKGKSGISRLDQFGLLHNPVQSEGKEEAEVIGATRHKRAFVQTASSFANMFWRVMNYGLLLLLALRTVVPAILSAKTLPSRTNARSLDGDGQQSYREGKPRAMLAMSMWSLAANLMELRARMPWLAGLLSLAQHATVDGPAAVGRPDGKLDR